MRVFACLVALLLQLPAPVTPRVLESPVMAAPAYRSQVIGAHATAANVTLTEPAGAVANDIEIMWLYREATSAITPPAGWSNSFNGTVLTVDATSSTAFRMTAYWIRRGGSAPPLTWTFASSFRGGTIAAYSGAETTGDPFSFGTVAVRDNSLAKTWPSTSGTTLTADELLIWCGVGEDIGGAGTQPTGFTERIDASLFTELADLAQAVAGGTGSVTGASYAGGTARPTTLCLMGLKPVGVGPAFIAARNRHVMQAVNRAGTY